MAESFDHDPFLLFKRRGMEREGLLAALRDGGASPEAAGTGPALEPEPLPLDHNDFWGNPVNPESTAIPPGPASTPPCPNGWDPCRTGARIGNF